MPVPKTKQAKPVNGVSSRSAKSSGATTPVSTKDSSEAVPQATGGRPDKKAHEAEQDTLKAEIDAFQVKLSAVKEKITHATKSSEIDDRRSALRAELDGIRSQQSDLKTSRGEIIEKIKSLQEDVQKKKKDLQAARAKVPFKTVADIDERIQSLEKQVESGNMKLADEKRALQEISNIKRSRRVVEGFQAEQDAIETNMKTIDELRAQLDDPEFKAMSDRYDQIKVELDEIKKVDDEAYADRSKLFEEREALQAQLSDLFGRKRSAVQAFREQNDRYWAKVHEDRARRAERAKAQRAAEEAQKKKEFAQRLREEAEAPAFQADIEDCQTLIDYFSGKPSSEGGSGATAVPLSPLEGVVPKLEIRQVAGAPEGSIVLKKKTEVEEAYFVGGKAKSKAKKLIPKEGGANGTSAAPTSPAADRLNIPFGTLSALMKMMIPPPTSAAEVPRIIEDLKIKKAWYEANQARVTAENIGKAESEIQRLTQTTNEAKAALTPTAQVDGAGEASAPEADLDKVDTWQANEPFTPEW